MQAILRLTYNIIFFISLGFWGLLRISKPISNKFQLLDFKNQETILRYSYIWELFQYIGLFFTDGKDKISQKLDEVVL